MPLWKIKSKKYKKYRKKIWKVCFYFLIFFIFLVFLSRRLTSWQIFNFDLPNYLPGETTKKEESLQANIYFNNEIQKNKFTEIIENAIENAEKSIEVAMYSFNLENLRDKIYEASERGLDVTLILDIQKDRQHDLVFANSPADIKIIYPGQGRTMFGPNMHHKFAIFDRGTSQEKLITGSLNWTELQEAYDPSFLFSTTDPEIIQAYGFEFELLEQNLQGTQKLKNKDYKPWFKNIIYNDCFLDIWFSPGVRENSINQKIADLIKGAEKNIKIMIWQASDQNISQALLEKAKQGLDIKIISEDYTFWEKNSIFPHLISQKKEHHLDNLEILNDAWRTIDLKGETPNQQTGVLFNPFLHHHTLIIDNQTVVFGTNNWSQQALESNDEDIIITNNQKIVNQFQETFDFQYQKLRKQKLKAEQREDKVAIELQPEYEGQKIMAVISEFRGLKGPFVLCLNKKIEKGQDSFSLPEKCIKHPLNIFIYNPKNYNLLANTISSP
jgi:phosphatidylserine/phosphatidylglycerophosphate/cardiolipin synthase-like enzyme